MSAEHTMRPECPSRNLLHFFKQFLQPSGALRPRRPDDSQEPLEKANAARYRAALHACDVAFFDADIAAVTGHRTGDAAELGEIAAIANGCGLPVVLGSGVTPANVGDMLRVADSVILGSSLKHDGVRWNRVDPHRLAASMAAAHQALVQART